MPSKRVEALQAEVGKLYTLYDVTELTGFSIITVRNHMQKGALVTIKIGGSRRVREEDLKMYLKGTTGEGKLK